MPDLYTASRPIKINIQDRLGIKEEINVRFEDQRNNEIVLLLLRKHWLTNLGWLILGVLLFIVPLIFKDFPALAILPLKYRLLVFIGWYLLLIAYLFEKFLGWFYNVGIVTDQRVVDIDFYGLLYKEVSTADLDKIQDVTQKQIGAVRTVFNFGNILIQTAAETQMLEFEDIPQPDKVAKLLNDLLKNERQ